MKPLVEKLRILATALCLIATLSSFVVAVSNHQLNEETSNEIVKFEECEEAITDQQQRRRRKKSGVTYPYRTFAAADSARYPAPVQISSVTWANERASLNGAGCYLRI